MFQGFEWDLPADGNHWNRLLALAPFLKEIGVSSVWLPPAYKGTSVYDTGYSTYDLYDVGEFDQKGTVATKYGTAGELKSLIDALHEHGIAAYADIVFNHKAGADETEKFMAVKVDPMDRNKEISKPFEIEGWTKFTFPGRGDTYSSFKWLSHHFTAVDFDQATGEKAIFRILGCHKSFADEVDPELGNYDYLMHADIDHAHPDVRNELFNWGEWFLKRFRFDGVRFDAVKHIEESFVHEFLSEMRARVNKDLFAVGEYWTSDTERMKHFLNRMRFEMSLFDVALHFNFAHAAKAGGHFDLRTIFDNTLVGDNPQNVVTFVDNHDSQPGQALESWVDDWFKPLAYALILLRNDGYPCLFYGDYCGIAGGPGRKALLDPLLKARSVFAYGAEDDCFDDPNCIAFRRRGLAEKPGSGLICILSNEGAAEKNLTIDGEEPGTVYVDMTGNVEDEVVLDDTSSAVFHVAAGSVSVWVKKDALETLS